MSEPTEQQVEAAVDAFYSVFRLVTREERHEAMRAALSAAAPRQAEGWQPIETAPEDQRVLLYNEMWSGTFGEVQIGNRQQGKWLFDSEMNINDGVGDSEDGITDADYLPVGWMPLPKTRLGDGNDSRLAEPDMTPQQIREWIEACNHEPARRVLRHYIALRSHLEGERANGDHDAALGDEQR